MEPEEAAANWQCRGCQEQVEGELDACWKCGTGRDGTPDPTFRPATETDAVPEDARAWSPTAGPSEPDPVLPPITNPEAAILRRFRCIDCGHAVAVLQRVTFRTSRPRPFFELFDPSYIAAICQRCGRVALYDPEVVERSGDAPGAERPPTA